MMSKPAGAILGLAIALTMGACAHREAQTAVRLSAAEPLAYSDACPLAHIRGVQAHATDVPGGVAIVFEAPDRAVGLVRANVRAMVTASDQQSDPFVVCPCGESSTVSGSALLTIEGGGRDLGLTSMQPPSSTLVPLAPAAVQETPTGATLVLTAMDGADADVLRSAVRQALRQMAGCLSAP